jgi:Flp pilus assembly protein CpaB
VSFSWLRERGVQLAALALGVLGVGAGLAGGGRPPSVQVLVAARPLAPGVAIPAGALRLAAISASDRTPAMLGSPAQAVYRRLRVALRAGDYVLQHDLVAATASSVVLRPGMRALALRLDPAAAPPPALLRPGARVDAVIARSGSASRGAEPSTGLQVLAPARTIDGFLVVTVAARLDEAVSLAAAQAAGRDVRVLLRPTVVGLP